MFKTKLVAIFYELSPHEKRAFRQWVHAGIGHKNPQMIQLLDYLYPIDLEQHRALLDRKLVYQAVFGEAPFNMALLRHLSSALTQVLEQFLVYQYRKKQILDFQLDLSNIYKQKGLLRLAQQSLQKAQKLHQAAPYQDIQQLKRQYEIELALYRQAVDQDRAATHNLQALNDSFEVSFLAEKLKHSCRILSHQGMYAQEYQTGLLEQVLAYLEANPSYIEVPSIALYYYYYQASSRQEEQATYFGAFKDCLFTYEQLLPDEEVRDLYILATNYSIRRLNTEQRAYYLQESFELYERALERGFLLEQQQLSPFAFTNIIAIALSLNKAAWVADFIHTYTPHLPKERQVAYRNYNLSRYYFHQKAYQKAIDLLAIDEFEDLHLGLSAKMLLLKIYYELREFQLLEALLNRFRTYLSRQKGLGYHKKNYNNIIRFTKRLVTLNPYSDKEKQKFRRDLEQIELLTERTWLLKQLELL